MFIGEVYRSFGGVTTVRKCDKQSSGRCEMY